MTKNEMFHKNLIFNKEFALYIMEHPEAAEKIPRNAMVVFLPEDDPELAEANLRMAEDMQEPGQPIVLVKIGRLLPIASRITELEMEIAEDY